MAAGAADPINTASEPDVEPCPKGVGAVEESPGELCGTARGPGASADISGLPKGPFSALSAAKGEIDRGGSGARRIGGAGGDVCLAAGRNAVGPAAGTPTGKAPLNNCSKGSKRWACAILTKPSSR